MQETPSTKRPDITPVILAGGAGERLRPLTSPERPKPFLRLLSNFSLLQETVRRVAHLPAPVVVCDEAFASLAAGEIQALRKFPLIIGEPLRQGTAAAVALAALALADKDDPMLVMPSDHHIADEKAFRVALDSARAALNEAPLVILGVTATEPQTRYGYILTNGKLAVRRFTEKPGQKRAQKYIDRGFCFWNTGIFLTRPSYMLDLFRAHAPDILGVAEQSFVAAPKTQHKIKIETYPYNTIRAASIDRAVMEKVTTGQVIPLNAGWSDVGSWPELIGATAHSIRKIFTS